MKKLNVTICTGGGGSYLNGCVVPVPVRVSETGRARNWTMPPLRPERECRERTNRASVDNTCKGFDRRENQRCAFTMAEILLSLTIIGVVAAITLPSLTGNINERTWNTQRKALYARFSQAISLMPALNGYGTLTEDTDGNVTADTAAETFVTSGLAKVLKINNICDNEHLEDCGIVSRITALNGSQIDTPNNMSALNPYMVGSYSNSTETMSLIDTKAAAFETANGESIVVFYNPACVGSLGESGSLSVGGGSYIAPKMCANFIYDLNGNKGPNTMGKDIGFITVFWPSDAKIVAPVPANRPLSTTHRMSASSVSDITAAKACTNFDSSYRLPNLEELMSMRVNEFLLQASSIGVTNYWSSTRVDSTNSFFVSYTNPQFDGWRNENVGSVWCIKR